MTKLRVLALIVILSVAAAACSSSSHRNKTVSATQMSPGYFGITPGSGWLMQADNHIVAGHNADMDDFVKMGVRWIRSTIPWKNFEPTTAETYNFKGVDDLLNLFDNNPLYASRFKLIMTIESPPSWAKASTITGCPDNSTPFNLGQYADAVQTLWRHLETRSTTDPVVLNTAHVFEIENSPNVTHDPSNPLSRGVWPHANPCGYAQLLKAVYPKVHADDAKVAIKPVVLVGGLGGTHNLADLTAPNPNAECLNTADLTDTHHYLCYKIASDDYLKGIYQYGGQGSFDGVSYHPYSAPNPPCTNATLTPPQTCAYDSNTKITDPNGIRNGWDRMLNARAMMDANGDGAKRIWMTEYGAATAKDPFAGGNAVITCQQQAQYLTNAYNQRALMLGGKYGPISIYTYPDGNSDGHNGYYMGLYGTVTPPAGLPVDTCDGLPAPYQKPSWIAYRNLANPNGTVHNGNTTDLADFGD